MSASERGAPGALAAAADRDALLAERDRLLGALGEIDAERDAGELDEDTHAALHRDYTARAAAVLRRLEQAPAPGSGPAEGDGGPGADPGPSTPSGPGAPARSRRRRFGVLAALVVAATALTLVVTTATDRAPGQTITGNTGVQDRLADLEQGVRDRPDDYPTRIAYARALLSVDVAAALDEYRVAAELDPDRPEPHAYTGWLLGRRALLSDDRDQRTELLDAAMDRLAHARALDPDYVDARVFTGVLLLDGFGDAEGAIPHLQQAIAAAPDAPQADLNRQALARAVAVVRSLADARCEEAAAVPADVDAQLACARALLSVEPAEALAAYDAVAALAPARPEPHAYGGWIAALVAQQLEPGEDRDVLRERARTRIADALARDPDFAEAHLFAGMVALDLEDDPATAVRSLERAVELAGDDEVGVRAAQALTRARAVLEPPDGAGPATDRRG